MFDRALEVVSFQAEPEKTIEIHSKASIYRRAGKRLFDVVFATIALALLWPIIAALLILVARDGSSPVFGHVRVGKGGAAFKCWKIRTMVPDSTERLAAHLATDDRARAQWEKEYKLDNDPRVTPLGRFLRRSSLDELLQFWNVLVGQMSVVGPRPVTQNEVELYGDHAETVQSIRPGLTGLWQVSGRNAIDYESRVALDVHYVNSYGFRGDMAIVLWTVKAVLVRTGK